MKLLLHPLTCAVVAFWLLPVDPFAAGLMVGAVSGMLIGLMVTKLRISSWIASLAI